LFFLSAAVAAEDLASWAAVAIAAETTATPSAETIAAAIS